MDGGELLHPINYDPDDPEIITIYPNEALEYLAQLELTNTGGEHSDKATYPDVYPQEELERSSALKRHSSAYSGLDESISTNTPYRDMAKALGALRTPEEKSAQNCELWNNMANYGNHVGEQAAREITSKFTTLIPGVSKKRKAVEIQDVAAVRTEEARKQPKNIPKEPTRILPKRNKEHNQTSCLDSISKIRLSSPSSSSLASRSSSASRSEEAIVDPLNTQSRDDPTEKPVPAEAQGGIDVSDIEQEWEEQQQKISFDIRRRKKSARRRGLDNTTTNLNHADTIMWKAFQKTYTCDGKTPISSDLKHTLPHIDAQNLVDEIKCGRSSQAAYDNLGYRDTPIDKLQPLPDGGFVIKDANGIPLVAHFPDIYRPGQVKYYNAALVKLRLATRPNKNQSDTRPGGRGDPSTYVTGPDRPFEKFPTGTLNLASAWVSEGHKANIPRPSQQMISGGGSPVAGFQAVQEHFSSVSSLIMLQNYVLFKLSPESFWAHLKVRIELHKRNAAIRSVAANDPSLMSGRSYISNRQTNMHFDEKEAPEGWAPLVVLGTCKTGCLGLPGLGVKFSYLPGSMTFIRGRLIKHGVTDWEGDGNRFCIANFNHATEWKAAGVEPVF